MPPLHPRLLVALCAIAVSCPGNIFAQDATAKATVQSSSSDRPSPPSISELPDSPGAIWAKSQEPQQSPATQSANQESDSQAQKKPDEKLQRPVGTAAAEGPKVSGVTAAQPAGAAIAPAKQRRVRTIVLKVGAIVGASAALGAVIALSAGTPSKPPGAH